MRDYLLEALVTNYIRLLNLPDSNFVLLKLCSTLVTLFARPDSGWRLPLRHILTCLLSGNYVPDQSLPDMEQLLEASNACSLHQLKGVLMLALVMAEDLGGHSSSAMDEGRVTTQVAANCLDAWLLFSYCTTRAFVGGFTNNPRKTNSQQADAPYAEGKSSDLLQLTMQATPYWTSIIKRVDNADSRRIEGIARECISVSAKYLDDDARTGTVLQMLISLEHSSAKLLRDAIPNFPASIATTHKAKELVDKLIQGDFTPEGILYVDLLESIVSHLDVTKPDFLHDHRYSEVVRTLQRLLRCDAAAGVEDPVCQIMLEKISEMVEGYTDWEDVNDPAKAFLKALTADACEACLLKIRLPPEQMSSKTQDWDADDRAKFQDFRYDVQDFFQSAFTVLGNALVEEIVKSILVHGDSPDWSTFEAGTFSLMAFSDTMSSDPDMYDGLITTVLGSRAWSYLLQSVSGVPDRALQTGIKFIAENVVYLQRYPDRLVLVLNFLFSSLHLQASASAASRAIYSLCDSHRGILREGLPQFMGSLETLGGIGEAERHRIYAAVATIIQALRSDEAKVQPLRQILTSISNALTSLRSQSLEKDEVLRGSIDIMQTLASVGKGLRSPADVPVDLEASGTMPSDFWTNGPGASIQLDVLGLYRATVQRLEPQLDNVFIDACCDFIKSGFTEEHPSPFKFPDSIGLELVGNLINLENPSIDNTMACASSFLTSVDPGNIQTSVTGVLYSVISNQQRILSALRESQHLPNSNFPSSSLDFLARFLPKWGATWFNMQDSHHTATVVMEMALIIMADSDTLPRRSAATFFAALADFSGPETNLNDEVNARVRNILEKYGPRILSLVLRLLGGECARSELESLTEALKKFVQKQFMLTKAVLREAVKQEQGVMSEKALQATGLDQRNRFLAQVEGLRGARKTNDIVKDFWIECRGSGFGYIA